MMIKKLKNGLRELFSINSLLIWAISSSAVFLIAQIPISIFRGEYLYFGDGRPILNVVVVAVILGLTNATILPVGRTILSAMNSSSKLELYVSILTMSFVGTYASLGAASGILPIFSIALIPTALIVGAVLALIIIGFMIVQTKNQN
jgi:hypothetical protein